MRDTQFGNLIKKSNIKNFTNKNNKNGQQQINAFDSDFKGISNLDYDPFNKRIIKMQHLLQFTIKRVKGYYNID